MTDPSVLRQVLLHHSYSPLVAVQSTPNTDAVLQSVCGPQLLALSVLRPYGNNVLYGPPGLAYKITNTLLITRTYLLFPVRFEPLLAELLTVHNSPDQPLRPLFSVSLLEVLTKLLAPTYRAMFQRIATLTAIVPFDTLNHPAAQVFAVHLDADTVDDVRALIVEFRNFAFPKWFQIADLLVHVLVFHTADAPGLADFQAALKKNLLVLSIAVLLASDDPVQMPDSENATIDHEIQLMLLTREELLIPRGLDASLRAAVYDFVAHHLIPHMERKVRVWDDQVLTPRKSLTGRFFSASRKLFNTDAATSSTVPGTYNQAGHYYHRSLAEQIVRKLADWLLMLKDFKYAYSAYDMIKKDHTHDKAWGYVAALQEMCVVLLLLAQTQPLLLDVPPQKPDKNTLRKIRHDIIEPYIDNLCYTYKLRLSVKTYAIRAYIVVAELLFNMSRMFNIPWWWADLIEEYLIKAERELESLLGPEPRAVRAVLYERLGFVKFSSYFLPASHMNLVDDVLERGVVAKSTLVEEGHFANWAKLQPANDTAIQGLTRFRKGNLWYVLALREWALLQKHEQKDALLQLVRSWYAAEWCTRPGSVLAQITSTKSPESTDGSEAAKEAKEAEASVGTVESAGADALEGEGLAEQSEIKV